MSNIKPSFLITIDTEGDNEWSRPQVITTKNAEFLPRFQQLCQSYGFKPTYLTVYEMAKSEAYREFGIDILKRRTGEIGMHLHPWSSPPITPLTADDHKYHPYLIEYPESIIREKVARMTELLEDTFSEKMVSHRAGRWAFNEIYAKALIEHGYLVDCSVTPYVSWKSTQGDPRQDGGTDYRKFPDKAYYLDIQNISRPGNSPLMEIPVTIIKANRPYLMKLLPDALRIRALKERYPSKIWLRPNGKNLHHLLNLVKQVAQEKRDYIEFMLHSSELMPGGSPRFQTARSIEQLYDDLETLFDTISKYFTGATLNEYYKKISENIKSPNKDNSTETFKMVNAK